MFLHFIKKKSEDTSKNKSSIQDQNASLNGVFDLCKSPNSTTKQRGQHGEEIAKRYLKKHGYQILDQNFRTKYGEIDLIAEYNHVLFFIEVKFRNSKSYGDGNAAIHPAKQQKMLKAALAYLQQKKSMRCDLRLAALIINNTNQIDFFEFTLDDFTDHHY